VIMPGLWRRALARGAHVRLLLLTVAALALPAALGTLPVLSFLGGLLDRSTRARELVAALDSAGLVEMVRQLGDAPAAAAIPSGILAAALAGAALAPVLGGAALTVARAEGPVGFRGLLRGAGEYYGRLLRTMAVALVPFAIAGAIAAVGFYFAHKAGEDAVLDASATRSFRLALAVAATVHAGCGARAFRRAAGAPLGVPRLVGRGGAGRAPPRAGGRALRSLFCPRPGPGGSADGAAPASSSGRRGHGGAFIRGRAARGGCGRLG
jgi:hypothetical protein